MSDKRSELEQAIAALEGQRAILGDTVVDSSIAALKKELAALEPEPAAGPQQQKLVTVLWAEQAGAWRRRNWIPSENTWQSWARLRQNSRQNSRLLIVPSLLM